MRTVQLVLRVSLVALGVVCGLGVARTLQLVRRAPDVVPQPTVVRQTHAGEVEALGQDLGSLRATLAELQQQQARLREAMPTLHHPPAPQPAAGVAPHRPSVPGTHRRHRGTRGNMAPPEPAGARDDIPERPLDSEAQRALVQQERVAFEEQLAAEAADTAWAAWAAEEIERALAASTLPGTSLVASRCGETLCRLEFAFEDLQGRDMHLGHIPFVLPATGGGMWFTDPTDPLRLIVFAHRAADME
jgi:hypothetical protein